MRVRGTSEATVLSVVDIINRGASGGGGRKGYAAKKVGTDLVQAQNYGGGTIGEKGCVLAVEWDTQVYV